ncbi:MAG: hypothetical protein K9L17_00935 [Clostridiales bacterium]|nr:hypothetical protein [Clostridiales bacterium]MCF8021257.1 hypothetical protein [Clostridiales bacterium]
MSNLRLANLSNTTQKFIYIIVLGTAFMLLLTSFPGPAAAADTGDVVHKVGRNNLSSPEFISGEEPVPGGRFKFYEAIGDLSSGWCYFSAAKPVNGAEMQAVLDFKSKQLKDETGFKITGTSSLQGYKLYKYTAMDLVGVMLVLPDYFIRVEIIESGNKSASDFKIARNIAQQVLEGLIQNGLSSQPNAKVDQEKPASEGKNTAAPAAVITGDPLEEPVDVSNTNNIAAVKNGPTAPTTFTINRSHLVTYIRNYHWNYSKGSTPGTIGLKDQNGKMYGPWQASGKPGQGGVPNAYWDVFPDIVIPAGTYTVTDSKPSTWAQNNDSGGRGMGFVKATPHFQVAGDAIDGSDDSSPGTISPAGVGSVGNIPGPSNTTEAVVGITVPGLLATLLGALAGLGGNGGAPPGTSTSPVKGGQGSEGSSPSSSAQFNGSAREIGQPGRRRGGSKPASTQTEPERPVPGTDNSSTTNEELQQQTDTGDKPEIFIDTVDMVDSSGTHTTGVENTPTGNSDVFIDTAEDIKVPIQPDDSMTVKTAEGDTKATTAGIKTEIEDDRAIQPDTTGVENSDDGILIDTSAFEEPAREKATGPSQGAEKSEYDEDGFNAEGYNRSDYDKNGFDKEDFNREDFNKNEFGFNEKGINREGFDKQDYDNEGFNKEGRDHDGYDRNGFNKDGYDRDGFDQEGFDKNGFNKAEFDKEGFDREGFDQEGFNKDGFDRQGYNRNGFDREGYDRNGYDVNGYDRKGYNHSGYDTSGYDEQGYDKEGFNEKGWDRNGYDCNGLNRDGYDRDGFDREGFDKDGFNKAGFDKEGFDRQGFDREGFNKDSFDRQGYNRNGFDREGFDRNGYDVNGYDRKGYNRSGYDASGYNKQGYDKEGFNKEGWDRNGYDCNGFDRNGYDRDGYDKTGYNRNGYDREGYDRQSYDKDSCDEYGYDKDGFNQDGYDRDGYDREGFDYEGYNRSGYDPWGYDRQGYDKDGYHWSGYNADGYNRAGLHWSDNPYKGDSPFNVDTRNPFDGGPVNITEDNYGNQVDTGIDWQPTKPPLGEPYPRTVEKYGPKPWTTESSPEVEQPSAPQPQDPGVIGTKDPMNTLKNHEIGKKSPDIPEGNENITVTPEEQETTDLPEDQKEPEVPASKDEQADTPSTGTNSIPQHGDTIVMVGKGDGKEYPLEYDEKTGKWNNLLTGGSVPHEELESYKKDFERWQKDLGEDLRRIRQDIEKMSQRQDANSKAIDQNINDWDKLDQMQKASEKYGIGEKDGPGDVDNAIEELKNDMLEGKAIDRNKMEKINRVIDSRIKGDSTADTGERWKEKPWYKDVDSALKANAESVREVVTGQDSEGNISVLGTTARVMITAATGAGTAQAAMDGALTVAEAMHRIKQSIDRGESDFRSVSKAIGMVILEEEIGRMAGAAGEKASKEMLEKYPAMVNKAADSVEKALLKVSKANQSGSAAAGMISKESADEAVKNIEKQISELGSEMGEEGLEKTSKTLGSNATGSTTARTAAESGDDMAAAAGKTVSESTDDAASAAGKTVSKDADNIAVKTAADSGDIPGGTARSSSDAPTGDAVKSSKAPSSETCETAEQSINRGRRSSEEILDDPAAATKAAEKLQESIKDFDNLPPAKQQDIIKEQAIYDEYRIQAEEKTWNMADKVQRSEKLTIEDALEMKADPASMRTLKNMENADGMGTELGTGGSRKVQTEFNNVLNEEVYQPSYRDVQNHLSDKYNKAEIRVDTVRTPGKEYHPWDVNTDNDIAALRKVVGKDGNVEWVEIPRSEWEDIYYKSYAKNTGFNPRDAAVKFPDENWSHMSDIEQARRWAELHGESPTDVYHPEAARDFSTQRSAMTGGEQPLCPGAAQAADGEGRLVDSEGLGLMEEYKVNHYWEKGDLRSQTEALEQLKKTGAQARNLEQGYKEMGYKIADMPDNMKKALQVVEDSKLSPAARAARLQELGYDSPGDLADKISSRIGALRTAIK